MSQYRGPLVYTGDNGGNGVSGFWSDLPDSIVDRNVGIIDTFEAANVGYLGDSSGSAVTGSMAGKAFYGYTGSTCADGTAQGGLVNVGSNDDNEGFTFLPQVGIVKVSSSTKKLWFECKIQTSTIADTKHNLFAGLMQPIVPTTGYPLSVSDALVDKDQIGFVRYADATAGNGSVVKFVYKKTGQTAQMLTTSGAAAVDATNITTAKVATLVAATFIKLGFKIDYSKGAKAITVYVNGVDYGYYVTATNIAAATFPTLGMGLIFGVMNATGTTPGTSGIQWAQVAQLY